MFFSSAKGGSSCQIYFMTLNKPGMANWWTNTQIKQTELTCIGVAHSIPRYRTLSTPRIMFICILLVWSVLYCDLRVNLFLILKWTSNTSLVFIVLHESVSTQNLYTAKGSVLLNPFMPKAFICGPWEDLLVPYKG